MINSDVVSQSPEDFTPEEQAEYIIPEVNTTGMT